MSEVTDLVVIEKQNAMAVFTTKEQLDPIIEVIEKEARSLVPDVSTRKGRDAIASMAHKVARSKTYIDNAGKDLVAELKALPKQIDESRRIVRERLDALHISNFTLQGSTPKEKRAAMVKAFNAGSASVFLISLKAGGMGLNLTAADIVIHYDPWWNQAAQDQATDRAHRIGQQAHVQVYKLIAKDTIEERILELQNRKLALLDTISGCEEAGILNMSSEELLSLLKS